MRLINIKKKRNLRLCSLLSVAGPPDVTVNITTIFLIKSILMKIHPFDITIGPYFFV